MRSLRLNSTVFKFKSQQQRRSRNLSCSSNTVRFSAHILSSRSPNELWFFFAGKLRQLPTAFMEQRAQILMLAMMFWPANNIKNLPTISRTTANNVKNQPPNQWLATNYFLSPPINSSESQPIKGGICHVFSHILIFRSRSCSCFLSLYLCNVQVFFHAILISCLCFFISFPILS